jgi:hypothetical protein
MEYNIKFQNQYPDHPLSMNNRFTGINAEAAIMHFVLHGI